MTTASQREKLARDAEHERPSGSIPIMGFVLLGSIVVALVRLIL